MSLHENILTILSDDMDSHGKKSPAVQRLKDTGFEIQEPDAEVLSAYALHKILTGADAPKLRDYLTNRKIFARAFGKASGATTPDFQDSTSLFRSLVENAPLEKLLFLAKELDEKNNLCKLLLPDQITRLETVRQRETAFQVDLDWLYSVTGIPWKIQNDHKRVFIISDLVTDKGKAHEILRALKREFNQTELSYRLSEITNAGLRKAGMSIQKEKYQDEFGNSIESFKSANFYCCLPSNEETAAE